MKQLTIIALICSLSACIKKNAIRYDPDLVGTWVSQVFDSTQYWLVVDAQGRGVYREYKAYNNDHSFKGDVKYSAFELKMWVGNTRFKVKEWLTADMKNVHFVDAKDFNTLQLKHYGVDRRMVLKERILDGHQTITFYRLAQ
jgi:hypothetical protein